MALSDRCTCAEDGNASRCPHHTQEDFNSASGIFSPISAASIEFKTVYDDLMDHGFTAHQALYLLAAQVTGNPGIAPGVDAPQPPA